MSSTKTVPVQKRSKFLKIGGIAAAIFLITLGIFASNGWLPSTDPMTGKKTGWFGRALPKNASSSWNPLATPLPTPTPQLSKEYIYAGSRLLAVEDANATAVPPADIAVWRPSNGTWYVMENGQGSQAVTFGFGLNGDKPVPGDFDGDGKTDFSVWRPSDGVWYVWRSGSNDYYGFQFGISSDLPAQADYDGDGRTDTAVVRTEANNTLSWYVWSTANNTMWVWQFGIQGDIPGSADFTGDGIADLGVYRPSDGTYHILDSSTAQWTWYSLGVSGITCAIPYQCVVPSDYDGDGKADFAIYKASTATWYIRESSTGLVTSTQWGAANDLPVQNDYDSDGKTDLATFDNAANAKWLIRRSSNNTTRAEYYGTIGDIPVPAFYRR